MDNDSIDTLLLRHFGDNAPTPQRLEQRVTASLQREISDAEQQHMLASRIREQRVSRRSVVRMVALGSAGLGMLSAGISLISGETHHSRSSFA